MAAPTSQAATPEPVSTALTYDYGSLCRHYIAEAEAHYGIIPGMLEAMGEVEAGYANTIWPWTVSIGGQALYARNEAEAIEAVRSAVENGKHNIDMGCLQINWRWHERSASKPEVFLNPRANVYYAAHHLVQLEAEFDSWDEAIGAYHSRDPERAQAYLCRVYRIVVRRYPEIRDVVDESCPGLLPQQLVADDFVADWRAVAVVVDRPEARPAPASPTDDRATRTATYPNDPVSEPPAARIAADTASPPVPSQNAQAGQTPRDADAPSRCPNTIDHLRSADLARETDPAVPASDRPGKTQQAFAPPAHMGKPALPVKDRAGDPEVPAQDVLDMDVDDIAPALRTVEPGWDPFPEPGPRTGDVSASGISLTVPVDENRVRQGRGNDRGRPAKPPQPKTLLEALLLMEAEAVQERALAMVHALPFAIDQRPDVSIERTGPIIDFGPVHARPAIFGRGWAIHGQHGEVLTTADGVEDIAKALIGAYFEELTDSASKTAPLTTEG